jgi:hypothetical protein
LRLRMTPPSAFWLDFERFKVFMMVGTNMTVSWDVAPWNLIENDRCFRTVMLEVVNHLWNVVNICKSTRRKSQKMAIFVVLLLSGDRNKLHRLVPTKYVLSDGIDRLQSPKRRFFSITMDNVQEVCHCNNTVSLQTFRFSLPWFSLVTACPVYHGLD